VEEVHPWRTRRSCRGELVQWDTSTHDWLEGRGETIYLIHMIDDASSELTALFVKHESTEENMRLLRLYLERHGRPVAFYTDKASLFRTAPKTRRDAPAPRDQAEQPPTQIGRAFRELSINWIAAHAPQAKGRVERSFQTAQPFARCSLVKLGYWLDLEGLAPKPSTSFKPPCKSSLSSQTPASISRMLWPRPGREWTLFRICR
jgi:transposase InsO family protein